MESSLVLVLPMNAVNTLWSMETIGNGAVMKEKVSLMMNIYENSYSVSSHQKIGMTSITLVSVVSKNIYVMVLLR